MANKNYTRIWNGFQIQSPTYLDGHFEPDRYSIVKWETHEPRKVFDLNAGKMKISTSNCFVIGTLAWDESEEWFKFESVGTRYLEYRIDGLEEWIMKFCRKVKKIRKGKMHNETS